MPGWCGFLNVDLSRRPVLAAYVADPQTTRGRMNRQPVWRRKSKEAPALTPRGLVHLKRDQAAVMFDACLPFGPSTTVN